ncbi:MAG TPA: intradiol ring-cleavage dioxygenase [Chitinophagaceae bacterium]|nr:intradiol ring-cleavage dioxygenase [Chitinophagaceae bacterium]
MERKFFLKRSITALGVAFVAPLVNSCKKDNEGTTGSGSCAEAPAETEGPYPTKNPSAYVRSDIRDDRAGALMAASITIGNLNNNCAALAGVIVDIWHCDADGNYSEYGGSGTQSVNYQSVHFLRGRQVTDANGQVAFTTIFPGWYTGRATHIHVHIYTASGTSLKVTQIAFPDDLCLQVNSTGAAYGYTKGISGYIKNASDNIFSDDAAGTQMAAITGSLSGGYQLSISLNVKG